MKLGPIISSGVSSHVPWTDESKYQWKVEIRHVDVKNKYRILRVLRSQIQEIISDEPSKRDDVIVHRMNFPIAETLHMLSSIEAHYVHTESYPVLVTEIRESTAVKIKRILNSVGVKIHIERVPDL